MSSRHRALEHAGATNVNGTGSTDALCVWRVAPPACNVLCKSLPRYNAPQTRVHRLHLGVHPGCINLHEGNHSDCCPRRLCCRCTSCSADICKGALRFCFEALYQDGAGKHRTYRRVKLPGQQSHHMQFSHMSGQIGILQPIFQIRCV